MQRVFFACMLLVFSVGCGLFDEDKEFNPYENDYGGYFTAELNGESWRGLAGGNKIDKSMTDSAAFDKDRDLSAVFGQPLRREGDAYVPVGHLVIGYLPISNYGYEFDLKNHDDINDSHLQPMSSFFEADQDVLMARFRLLDGYPNTASVTSFDSSTNIVEGRFQVAFVFERGVGPGHELYHLRHYPDTLRFTNGRYRVKLREIVLQPRNDP